MEMNLSEWTIGGIISAGVAFGVVKASLYNKVSYGKHSEICGTVQDKIFNKIDNNHSKVMDVLMSIKQDIGELKGRTK